LIFSAPFCEIVIITSYYLYELNYSADNATTVLGEGERAMKLEWVSVADARGGERELGSMSVAVAFAGKGVDCRGFRHVA
jgi:hypothetical protein